MGMTLGVNPSFLRYGISEIAQAGRGLFTQKSLEKEECVGEYMGDLLEEIRAAQKSYIFNQTGMVYLFTRDKTTTIDAEYYGSLVRFANHKSEKESNCEFLILFCSGNIRIGLHAL